MTTSERLDKHNHAFYGYDKFTASVNDWQLVLAIGCKSISQARSIEAHIKKMKSRKYIENLKAFPEMTERLLAKYNP